MAKAMTVTTRSDLRKQSTEQARQGKYRPTGATSGPGTIRTSQSRWRMSASVESPGGLSPPGAPRTVREPLDSYGSRCSAVAIERLCFVHGLLPLPDGFSWPVASAEQRSPFGPAPLQGLRPYYELLRRCAPHRYSDP